MLLLSISIIFGQGKDGISIVHESKSKSMYVICLHSALRVQLYGSFFHSDNFCAQNAHKTCIRYVYQYKKRNLTNILFVNEFKNVFKYIFKYVFLFKYIFKYIFIFVFIFTVILMYLYLYFFFLHSCIYSCIYILKNSKKIRIYISGHEISFSKDPCGVFII